MSAPAKVVLLLALAGAAAALAFALTRTEPGPNLGPSTPAQPAPESFLDIPKVDVHGQNTAELAGSISRIETMLTQIAQR